MKTQEKILMLLEFGETSIDEIWRYCLPAMPQTVNRELRELEHKFNKIEVAKKGNHGAKISYRLKK